MMKRSIFLIAFVSLVLLVSQCAGEEVKPAPRLTPDEAKLLNSMEQEWAANIDQAVPFIQHEDYPSANRYLEKSTAIIANMKSFLTRRGYDTASIDRLIGMENLTEAYKNMAKIADYTKDPLYVVANMQDIRALFDDTRSKLNLAEAKFHELPDIQEMCRDFRGTLDEFEVQVKKIMRRPQ
jgi:hypothetical protein